MARRSALVISPLLILLLLSAPAVAHRTRRQGTDPSANSPAGAVYSIPLDNARQDASPHQRPSAGGGSAGGGAGGGTGSGPGGSGSGTGTGAGSPGGGSGHSLTNRSQLVPGGQPGSLVHSSNGYGSSSQIPGVSGPLPAGFRSVQGSGSSAPTIAILISVLVLALGGAAGAGAWRAVRPH